MSKKNNSDFNFEKTLQDLENIVKTLESSELSLGDSLNTFEKGVSLAKECEQHLKTAEQKIEKLTNAANSLEEDTFKTKPFEPNNNEDE